jgi:PIN like domain
VHRKWSKQTTPDDDWIASVSEKHWRIVTADKDLEYRYHEVIVAAKAAIFVVKELKQVKVIRSG